MNKLNKQEKKENTMITVGRLITAIRYPGNTSQPRMLEMILKIAEDIKTKKCEVF